MDVLQRADPALVDPGVTAQMERLLDDVLVGRQNMMSAIDAVCDQASRIIGRLTERGASEPVPSTLGTKPPSNEVSAGLALWTVRLRSVERDATKPDRASPWPRWRLFLESSRSLKEAAINADLRSRHEVRRRRRSSGVDQGKGGKGTRNPNQFEGRALCPAHDKQRRRHVEW